MTNTAYLTRAREFHSAHPDWTLADLAALLTQVRNETLEEAAKVCDENADEIGEAVATTEAEAKVHKAMLGYTNELGEAIRSLKTPG